MAIASDDITIDNVAAGTSHSGHTFNHTCTGSDLVLVVFVHIANSGSDHYVTGVTYNAVSLTEADQQRSSGECCTSIWYLEDPATGSNEVAVTFNESFNHGSAAVAHSYTGADTVQNGAGATGTSDAASQQVTTTSANSWVVAAASWHGGDIDPFSPDSGDTEEWDAGTGANSSTDVSYTGGYLTTTTTGNYTWGTTGSASDGYAICAAELTEAAGLEMEISMHHYTKNLKA